MTCNTCGKQEILDDDEKPVILWTKDNGKSFCCHMCWMYDICPTKAAYLTYLAKPDFETRDKLKKKGTKLMRRAIFDTYYDHALGVECTSYKDQEKKVKEHNKTNGRKFQFFNDDQTYIKELKYRSKHREEYKASLYPGYRPGERTYDTDRPDQHRNRNRVYSFRKR